MVTSNVKTSAVWFFFNVKSLIINDVKLTYETACVRIADTGDVRYNVADGVSLRSNQQSLFVNKFIMPAIAPSLMHVRFCAILMPFQKCAWIISHI